MENNLEYLKTCIIKGKVSLGIPHPKDMVGLEGADEVTFQLLQKGFTPFDILNLSLLPGMKVVGNYFKEGKYYIPDVLMSAKAMKSSMKHLEPYFTSGDLQYKGTVVLGTVIGDLHDIGKNLVKMVLEGGGYKIIDVGVDASAEKFINAIQNTPNVSAIGLSALLTSTMLNMKEIISLVKNNFSHLKVLVGGAPVTEKFANEIEADFYSPNPQDALIYLNGIDK